jgi:succinate dehydrogenase / fumarate reductase cytochrome b subunit
LTDKSNFLIRRLHSLLAIIPIGIFLIVHLTLNSGVFLENVGMAGVVAFMKGIPLIWVAEVVIIAIPILFHAIYGIYIVYVAKNNALNYKYVRNWGFYLQRITAVITLVFLACHVFLQRFMHHEPTEVAGAMVTMLQNPLYFILFAVGFLSVVFHFANGLFTFLITWGIIVGDYAQKFFQGVTVVVFLAISVWGLAILAQLAGYINIVL